jgi:enoyl-[acyl-carrier-protein] reductase (NADH)
MPTIKKEVMFKKEREEIIKQLLEIMKLDENNSFYLYDLDNDTEKQQKLIEMKEDIAKFFSVGRVSAFNKNACKRPYLNIFRNIMKQHGYKIISYSATITRGEKKVHTMKYVIINSIK